MAKHFCIFVHDSRKALPYRGGYAQGYLQPDGELSPDQRMDCVIVDSIDKGNEEIASRGFENTTSVRLGAATAYVCEYLGA